MICLALALILVAIGAYVSWPRNADLRAFDSAEIAQLETAMWRDYYDKRYPALFFHLYELSRTQFGFSPLDSLRIAFAAARAARAFQPTRSHEAANAALPALVTYYRLLASAAPGGFDVEEAARLELDWWQARREAVGPAQYGVTVARVAAITYGKRPDDPSLGMSGIGRAGAMAYRDARGQAMTDQDWSELECRLRRTYRSLKAAGARELTRMIVKRRPRAPVACLGSRAGQQKSPGRCRGF
ncbi:hypothetical protein [Bradyrhizobium sp. AZCC 1614]|uniref:hypothetical protein n=1 Tax=Bradyrhizobium sp. AZCC 1614 TaxID=3117017 RepID=UPI002FF4122C